MRNKRVERFKKHRHKRLRKIILFIVVFPFMSILAGYLITALFILPIMSR